MLNEDMPEDMIFQLTPKGHLLMDIVESLQGMLLEQRQHVLSNLTTCVNCLHARDFYNASHHLTEALAAIGLENFGK